MAKQSVYLELVVKGQQKFDAATKSVAKVEQAANKIQGTGNKFSRAFGAMGKSAAGASGGVKVFGAALNSALGPIGAALAAVAGLGAAFNTLAGQDFAIAKVKTLGVDSDKLVQNLKGVSRELNGSASVAELTGAAYDVASAGFSDAADNAKVLKAAALGAAGGFTDMNTAGNALTSVLNAYGLSADQAEKIMDQFVQTQNDGKIVVAEYAANIGKVASAAASLGVPLAEVNAAIAQSTAAGVQAEVAFTGVKSALARLASGEASKALKGTGLEIDAASVAADGLIGTLRKMKAAGLDTGQIFKALGTEAAPALLPLLNNLEKTEELLKNQESAAGVAADAQKTATDTINGAWKRITTVFENFFSDQTAIGTLIKNTLNGVADTLQRVADVLSFVLTPFQKLLEFIDWIGRGLNKLGEAFGKALKESEGFRALQMIFEKIQPELEKIGKQLMAVISPAFKVALEFAGKFAQVLGTIVYKWLDLMIKGLVQVGKLIPGLGGVARNIEKGWEDIKEAVENTKQPVVETTQATKETADATQKVKENTELTKEAAKQLKEAQQAVTKEMQKRVAVVDQIAKHEQQQFQHQFAMRNQILSTEKTILDLEGQKLQRQLQSAKTQQEKVAIARRIYENDVKQAELERAMDQARMDQLVQQAALNVEIQAIKAKEVESVVKLAEAQGTVTQAHYDALRAQREALGLASNALENAYLLTEQQGKQADALLKGRLEAAKAAFEQNKVWESTEKAATAAGQFAGNMARAAASAQQAQSALDAGMARITGGGGTGATNVFTGSQAKALMASGYGKELDNGTVILDPLKARRLRPEQATALMGAVSGGFKWDGTQSQGHGGAKIPRDYFFASGGYIKRGEYGIVGEKGPELVEGPAMVTSNPRLKAAMGSSAQPGVTGSGNIQITYNGETIEFNDEEYIKKKDVSNLVGQAVDKVKSFMGGSAKFRLDAGLS